MEEGASLGKVVQTIMESLSEAISQLILFVMAMQESNSPMPNHIPPAAEGVTSASNTLADVATSVANEEYSDYPEIQNPIIEAAQDVRTSGEILLQAVANLKTNPDRGAGWANLLDACRTISGQTCYILQLVYGAELKRLLLAAQATIDLASKTQSPLAAKDPHKFAEQVSELAGMADALANFLREKAAEEESPLAKQEMLKSADTIANLGNDVLELANKILRDPKDSKLPPQYDAKIKELEREIQKAITPVREKMALLPEKPPSIKATPVPARTPNNPPPAVRGPDPPIRREPAPIPAGKRPEPPVSVPPPKLAQKAKDDLKRLITAANAYDSPTVAKEAQTLAEDVEPLLETLERLARDTLDPERRSQLQDAAKELKAVLPRVLVPAGQHLRDPQKRGSPELGKIQKQAEKVLDYVAEVAKPAPEIELAYAARALRDDIPRLTIAAARGDVKQVAEVAKKIQEIGPYVDTNTRALSERPFNPKQKTSALEAVKKIDQIIPEIVAMAQEAAPRPSEPKLQKLEAAKNNAEAALKDVVDNLAPNVLADVRKQQDDLNALDAAAVAELPKRVSDMEKQIVKREPKIEREVLKLANNALPDNPQLQKNLANDVSQLQTLLPPQIVAAEDVVKQPTKEEPKQKLNKNVNDMKKVLDNVVADVQKLPPNSKPKKTPEKLMDKLQDLMDAISASKDPSDEKALQNILNNMGPELEKILEQIPDEPTEQEKWEDKVEEASNALEDKMAELAAAANAGKDAATLDKLAKEVIKQGDEMVKAAKEVEKFFEPEEEEEEVKPLLDDALDDLSALLPEFVSAAKELGKNPRDPRKKKDLGDLGGAADKTRKFVKGVAKPPPEQKQADAARRFPKAVKKVIDAADQGPPEFLDALKNLKKVIRDLQDPLKPDGPDYLGGRDIAGAIRDLERRLADKGQKKDDPEPPRKPYEDAKNYFQKILDDSKNLPKADPKTEAVGNIKAAQNLLDRLEAVAQNPKDPKKLVNTTKALANKLDPIIKTAKSEAAKEKDPKKKKQLEDAAKEIEKLLPPLIEATKDVAKGDPSVKEKLEDLISQMRQPLGELEQIFSPDAITEATALGRKEDAAAVKLAAAANKGDVKNATDALKAIKDIQGRFAEKARKAAAGAPPDLKKHVDQNVNNLDELVKQLEPTVQALAANKDDPKARDAASAAAKALRNPISAIIEDLQFVPEAQREEAQELVNQILAALKQKNIKKIDPSNLLKISKHLAGLLSDMAKQTGDELRGSDNLSDRAKAALELEQLLSSLENSAKGGGGDPYAGQNVEELINNLTNLVFDPSKSSGGETQLTKQISSVAKEMRAKASGSLEGTQLHAISQNLAADLQKFAEADSGNKRSDLIILGKAISINIIRLADELKRLAANCTDPKLQEKLYLHSQVVRNYAAQLKIMASVRAASPKNNDYTSDQLVVLTKNLAAVMADATNVASIIKQTKKGQV